jgi:hypothetical protein
VNFEGFFVLLFWKFGIFNSIFVILGISKNNLWSFTKVMVFAFFSYDLWRLFVSIFWNSSNSNFLLVILCNFTFFVWSFTTGKRGYLPFILWTLKAFCFAILKIWNLQFFFLSFWKFHMGKTLLGVSFLNLRVFNFVLMEFKDLWL